jgi:hypothetical protein
MELDEIHRAASILIREETLLGVAGLTPELRRFTSNLDAAAQREIVRELQRGSTAERELAARMLIESGSPTSQVLEDARRALAQETDPAVLSWLVDALGYTRDPGAIPDLLVLSECESPRVRFAVPSALSMCAGDDVEAILDALLSMSADLDPEVRWSAAYELVEWLRAAPNSRISDRLSALNTSDQPREIAELVDEALRW